MRILCLEPYYGGSHMAFIQGWSQRSRHHWTILDLPAYKWKWRMRHAAITFAAQVAELAHDGHAWDALFCSDMLNLAEFKGLTAESIRRLPTVAYFHENHLTYPVRVESERDYQFAFTNCTTALSADAVWFNSAYHRDAFLEGLEAFLRRMPDHQPLHAIPRIRAVSSVHPPGISAHPPRGPRPAGPLRILWAARWEHDKNPEAFFAAIERLEKRGADFRLSVIGEQFRDVPPVFAAARKQFAHRIDDWGYLQSREDFIAAITNVDVIVSTARHEFFGIAVAEIVAAGAYPLLPQRLAYPELLDLPADPSMQSYFYPGDGHTLTDALEDLAQRVAAGESPYQAAEPARQKIARFTWEHLVPPMDEAIERITAGR
jgi:glycosyltransferase involved in cell wall biosynthesis